MLEWEKHETEKEISETTKALDWEIDMSRLYEGVESSTKYRLVSLVKSDTGLQMFLSYCYSELVGYELRIWEMYAGWLW